MPVVTPVQFPQPTPIGATLRSLRVAAGLTQQKLATDAGISLRTLGLIESGENCKVSTLSKIAEVLEVDVAELLGTAPAGSVG